MSEVAGRHQVLSGGKSLCSQSKTFAMIHHPLYSITLGERKCQFALIKKRICPVLKSLFTRLKQAQDIGP